MITDRDIKIMELLGDLGNKDIMLGCRIRYRKKYANWINYIHPDKSQITQCQDQYAGCHRERYYMREIIGQYHSGNILQWLNKVTHNKYYIIDCDGICEVEHDGCIHGETIINCIFKFDTSKPLMEQTEKKKEELYLLMKNVDDK